MRRGFSAKGSPRDLTFYFPCGTGDGVGIRGMDHVAIEGLMKRIVSGSYINPLNPATGKRPELMRLIRENAIEAYSWPIGASMHWLREVARRSPGYMTEIGIGCYIDPDQTGGRLTARSTRQPRRQDTVSRQALSVLSDLEYRRRHHSRRRGRRGRQSVVRERGLAVLVARAGAGGEGLRRRW